MLNMTVLGMFFSGFINGVAKRHGEVSQAMFPQFRVESITNGVHASTWVAPEIAELFDEHLPGWREDNALLADADAISLEELRAAHLAAKGTLFDEVIRRNGVALDPAVLTIGIARRGGRVQAKRPDLLRPRRAHEARRAERIPPDPLQREGAPGRRRRQSAHRPHHRARRGALRCASPSST